ncbi:4Fe-4S dicluster domain-containing protein, partial [Escherichia coli]
MNRFIMANSQQCLGCHACEIACVMAHNDEQHVLSQHHFHPRITVIKHQQQRSAVTCHHCEDAPCARSCPNGAISHVDDSIQVNQQKCIGCKSCVVACPFGTMQIVLTPVAAGKVKATAHKCASTAAQEMPVMSKVEQMQATPARGEPDKLAIEARKTGFDEIYLPFRADQAQREASRCLKCGEHSVCEWTCPLHNHIPQWIELVKAGNIDAAVELSHQTNTLPEITGRVCPQDRLCEGPAGLACADVLTRNGVGVTVYDRHPEIGGLLTFGIPSFKLDKSLLARRREIFSAMGIHFELNCEVGKDVSLDSLLEQYDAVFVGVGTYRSMKAGLPNEDAPGVYDALPFLIANTKQVMGLEELPEEPFINTAGLNVVVLGGGDTA